MQVYRGPLGDTELLLTIYDDGAAEVATRPLHPLPHESWSAPIPLRREPIADIERCGVPGCTCTVAEERAALAAMTDRKHHPQCPVNFAPDKPERCQCIFMAALDRTEQARLAAVAGTEGGR